MDKKSKILIIPYQKKTSRWRSIGMFHLIYLEYLTAWADFADDQSE